MSNMINCSLPLHAFASDNFTAAVSLGFTALPGVRFLSFDDLLALLYRLKLSSATDSQLCPSLTALGRTE